MASVELQQVSKIFDNNVTAVNSVDIKVNDKEFIVLVGPSGCGKSTILRMIAGLEDVTSGRILIDNEVVNEVPPRDRDIAMVFQNYALYPHMTVFQNMAFGLSLRKFPKDEIENRVKEAAAILDIEHLLDRKPRALSGGQRQRVAVGRAIVRKPKVFLFDEPLSNLDAKLRVQMRTEISKLHSRLGATMVYVTHDQVEAMTMGDRIVVLKDGEVQQMDTPLNLYNQPANKFVAGFIGSPAMNFIRGTLRKDQDLIFTTQEFQLPVDARHTSYLQELADKQVELGIRPEDIFPVNGQSVRAAAALTVEVVEPMGNEIFLYLKAGSQSITARTEPTIRPEVDKQFPVGFDMKKAHYFNPETGAAIC